VDWLKQRKCDLEAQQLHRYKLLNECEQDLTVEDDPIKKSKLTRYIRQLRQEIKTCDENIKSMQQQTFTTEPIDKLKDKKPQKRKFTWLLISMLLLAIAAFFAANREFQNECKGNIEVVADSPRGKEFKNKNKSPVTYYFKASGSWTYAPGEGWHDANGHPKHKLANSNYLLPGYPEGSLIVRRGDGRYEEIGTEKKLSLESNETVFFLINDASNSEFSKDNKGELKIDWHCVK
jgi:hypothetical protein